MADLAHAFGADLQFSAGGDLLIVSGAEQTQQRVLRRLLTNPLGYPWHPGYGAGLARFVGQPTAPARLRGLIARQMRLERGVAPTPAPSVDLQATSDGTVTARIRYADRDGTQVIL